MSFLAPLFLVGLAAVAVPIFVHLIQRERKRVVQFPSLMFVQKIPSQSVQRRRIRHWFLLLMRAAAIPLSIAIFNSPPDATSNPSTSRAMNVSSGVTIINASTPIQPRRIVTSPFKYAWKTPDLRVAGLCHPLPAPGTERLDCTVTKGSGLRTRRSRSIRRASE